MQAIYFDFLSFSLFYNKWYGVEHYQKINKNHEKS